MAREACTSVAESNNANCICIYTCDIIHIYIFMVFYSIYIYDYGRCRSPRHFTGDVF